MEKSLARELVRKMIGSTLICKGKMNQILTNSIPKTDTNVKIM